MSKSRFSQRLRNKLNRGKEAEVPKFSLQHLQPSFLPRNRRQQVSAQKALKGVKPEGLLQTVKENGQRKKPNEKKAPKKKTLNFTERPITIQILQRERRRRQKQKKWQGDEAFKQMIKTKQPQKVWVDKGTVFKGSFKTLCEKKGIKTYTTESEKNPLSPRGTFDH